MRNFKEQCATDPDKDFKFLWFVNKLSSFWEVERNKMQAFELTQKCINSISELTLNKYKNANSNMKMRLFGSFHIWQMKYLDCCTLLIWFKRFQFLLHPLELSPYSLIMLVQIPNWNNSTQAERELSSISKTVSFPNVHL